MHIKDTEFTYKIILESEIAVSLFFILAHFSWTADPFYLTTGQVKQWQIKWADT